MIEDWSCILYLSSTDNLVRYHLWKLHAWSYLYCFKRIRTTHILNNIFRQVNDTGLRRKFWDCKQFSNLDFFPSVEPFHLQNYFNVLLIDSKFLFSGTFHRNWSMHLNFSQMSKILWEMSSRSPIPNKKIFFFSVLPDSIPRKLKFLELHRKGGRKEIHLSKNRTCHQQNQCVSLTSLFPNLIINFDIFLFRLITYTQALLDLQWTVLMRWGPPVEPCLRCWSS